MAVLHGDGERRIVVLGTGEGIAARFRREMMFGIAEIGIVMILSGLMIMTVGYAARARPIGPVLIGIGIVVSLAVIVHYVIGSLQ
jgi:hypothetical protein